MIRRPPRSTLSSSSAASDVYKRQLVLLGLIENVHDGVLVRRSSLFANSDVPSPFCRALQHLFANVRSIDSAIQTCIILLVRQPAPRHSCSLGPVGRIRQSAPPGHTATPNSPCRSQLS
eukprot:TRINITY_DN4271_c0_g1_i2.p2 TRINITY_DN4271_c0_g1~~TRINITY_DN4271_c0_g1_i2.p2  ORF type:complete len:119 (-),score=4.39 TRINITY_DN4271_c0_g1_i2:311-667(-)